MSAPDKKIVLNKLRQKYGCSLSTITGKQIMYQGVSGEKRIVVCTPYSKIHTIGKGWFDLTIKQVELLDDADISVLAVRLEDGNVYYVDFKELRKMITPDNQLVNSRVEIRMQEWVVDHLRGGQFHGVTSVDSSH
ncbi:hypothetical protein [Paenibacillus elgii]|uniref:hypothetical protein n=1 Tax=Paenibacillus elgii TaxID=189691 RepID=UPI000248CB10|nr:hypothetical protein [Paenibacillus elgii]